MLNHGKSSGIISNNKLIHLSLCYSYSYTIQGRNEPVQWGSNSPGNEITMGHRMTAGSPKISNNVTNTSFNTVILLP